MSSVPDPHSSCHLPSPPLSLDLRSGRLYVGLCFLPRHGSSKVEPCLEHRKWWEQVQGGLSQGRSLVLLGLEHSRSSSGCSPVRAEPRTWNRAGNVAAVGELVSESTSSSQAGSRPSHWAEGHLFHLWLTHHMRPRLPPLLIPRTSLGMERTPQPALSPGVWGRPRWPPESVSASSAEHQLS